MATPWYMYPMDSPGGGYQEMTDPMGNYLKPDTNMAVPSGTPITTWDSGVVTSVIDRGRSLAGLSVTIKLDHPPNSQAQYASFNYLGRSTVSVGQRVTAGQQVGTAGSPYGINFALALGVSPVWGAQCPQCSSKQPNLDPRIVLNALRAGKGLPSVPSAGTGSGTAGGDTTSAASSNPFDALGSWLSGAVAPFATLFSWLSNPIRIIKLIIGIALIGVAVLMFLSPEGEKLGRVVARYAPDIAEAAA